MQGSTSCLGYNTSFDIDVDVCLLCVVLCRPCGCETCFCGVLCCAVERFCTVSTCKEGIQACRGDAGPFLGLLAVLSPGCWLQGMTLRMPSS